MRRSRSFAVVLLALAVVAAACTDDTTDGAADDTTTSAAPAASDTSAPTTTGAPPPTVPDQGPLPPNATVERVVDGDTIVADIDGQRERVRLLGIDTPESVAENRPDQCYGQESSDYLSALLPEGSAITLILDEEARDQYDRLLAYVVRSSDDLFVNLDLIEQGYAGVLVYAPNDHYESLFRAAEREALAAGVGLWGACGGPDVPLE